MENVADISDPQVTHSEFSIFLSRFNNLFSTDN